MPDRAVARVYFIDWLRILAVLLLFPRHTMRVFDEADPFYVKALPVSFWVGRAIKFIEVWHMPLLFFLAGCATFYALGKRSAGQYTWERVKRLLVPFVFGVFILIPPQTWFGGRSNSGYTGSYWHYLASGDFLAMNIRDGGDYFGGFGIGQLWFIIFLLLISLVALPLALWTVRSGKGTWMNGLSRFLAHPAGWLVAIVVLFFADLVPKIPGGPIVFYLFVFIFGIIAVRDPSFMESAERYRIPALVAGVGLSVFWAVATTFRESFDEASWQGLGLRFGGMVATWLMLMGILGFGERYLNRTSRVRTYLAQGSYPVYILHQTVIVVLAFYIVQIGAPRPVLWVILLVAAVLGTFALYEIARRINVLRFLLGMRWRRRAPEPVEAVADEG
jgi:glucans biosynthesis protein C